MERISQIFPGGSPVPADVSLVRRFVSGRSTSCRGLILLQVLNRGKHRGRMYPSTLTRVYEKIIPDRFIRPCTALLSNLEFTLSHWVPQYFTNI